MQRYFHRGNYNATVDCVYKLPVNLFPTICEASRLSYM
jgi:hypothetical protein